MTQSQQDRYRKILLTLTGIRQDIKAYNLIGTLPDYANNIYDMKELESHYAKKAYDIRNGYSQ